MFISILNDSSLVFQPFFSLLFQCYSFQQRFKKMIKNGHCPFRLNGARLYLLTKAGAQYVSRLSGGYLSDIY